MIIKFLIKDAKILIAMRQALALPLMFTVIALIMLRLSLEGDIKIELSFAFVNVISFFALNQIVNYIVESDKNANFITRIRLANQELAFVISRALLWLIVAIVWCLIINSVNSLLIADIWRHYWVLLMCAYCMLVISNFSVNLMMCGSLILSIIVSAPMVLPALITAALALSDDSYKFLLLAFTLFITPVFSTAGRLIIEAWD